MKANKISTCLSNRIELEVTSKFIHGSSFLSSLWQQSISRHVTTLFCFGPQGKEVYLVRHAQGEHNVAMDFSYDPPLTPEGHSQVRIDK
jgi:hypothetical protein